MAILCEKYQWKYRIKVLFVGVALALILTAIFSLKESNTTKYTIPILNCNPDHPQITQLSFQENLDIVKNYSFPREIIDSYKKYYEIQTDSEINVARVEPVIATGASSNHFTESLFMLESLQKQLFPRYPGLEVYYYDLGLWEWQRERIKKYPRVHLRLFPFSQFPPHVSNLDGFTWKPIIIQMMLKEFGFVMWMDASARFIDSDQDRLFEAARNNGVLYRNAFSNLAVQTDYYTFAYLNENSCAFSKQFETEANLILIYRNLFINDYFMKPLFLCALTFGCMVTNSSYIIAHCEGDKHLHACHRFDQSVFSILVRRLLKYDKKYHISEYSHVEMCRGNEMRIPFESMGRIVEQFYYWKRDSHQICRSKTR